MHVANPSIASRAGKPKGSKNKATLKKLENLQVTKRNASSKERIAAWITAPKATSTQSPLPARDRRPSGSASAALHYEMVWPSHSHPANRTHRKYSVPERAASSISPISTGYRPYTWEGGLSIDLESFGFMETPYMSPAHSQYMQSPGEESTTNWSNVATEPVTPVDLCRCMHQQALSQNKLYNLGRDPAQWLFEPTIDIVFSALSSCQSLFNCALCSKETNNLLAATFLLDRLFAVLAQTVFQAVPANIQESSMGRVPCTSPPATRKSLVDRSLKTAQETLDLLKGLLDPSVDLHTVSGNVDMSGLAAFANTDLMQKDFTNQAWGIFGQDTGTAEQLSPPIFESGNPRNNVDSGHMTHLREFVCRYESMLENLQVAVSYNIAPKPTSTTTAASFGLQAAWIPNVFGVSSAPQFHYPQPFQHSGSAYNVVGF
ncbi:hypothetical protein PISL3812_03402 [Talaromyces islandicus]|uniref:Uncharacterized protein n=1 Tax=Talaromyces islandicus TaxID=28573 RepID=A0A0U1LUC9_TALIS|nr:hypothetical protein PISL3812_03402 [Talaromyces islandicus]